MKFPKITLKSFCYLPILFLSLLVFNLNAQQLAFPTAKGAGAYSTGGRGGQVIHVTTLDFAAPGGLKEAIETEGPRIIVFDVSGVIDASNNEINPSAALDLDNMTIAGQTAPHGGITVVTSYFIFRNMSDVIVRYVRFRSADTGFDALAHFNGTNVIYDHCTFSHGSDEAGSWNSNAGHLGNVTIQNCFFQDSKTGTLLGVGGDTGDFTFINNLYSSISHRFPNAISNGQYDIINNVVYNWKYRLMRVAGSGSYNVINNYYKTADNGIRRPSWFPGNGVITTLLHKLQVQTSDSPLIYGSGSIITGQRETPLADDSDMWTIFTGSYLPENDPVPAQYFTNTQFPLVGLQYPIKTADQAYIDVLNEAGSYKTLNANGSINLYRDDKDSADLLMIQNDTYDGSFFDERSTIPHPVIPHNTRPDGFDTNNDGMPDVWKASRGFGPDEDLSSYVWPSGYVGVEEYLNEIDLNGVEVIEVTSVEVTPETATINMPDTVELLATVLPVNASNQSGFWSSSDETIAIVNNNGLVTPVSEGEVTITFTTNDLGFTDEATITVTNIVTSLESVIVTPETVTLELGESVQLATEFLPLNTTDTTGVWSSNDESIAIVDENGYVTAMDVGQVEIAFVANDEGITDSATVTVVDNYFGTYILYNAESDEEIQNIEGDSDINLEDESSQINFRSIPEGGDENPAVESVGVVWTGPTSGSWIESDAIYAGLPIGHVDLNFEPYEVSEGTYNFTVTYYSGNSGAGNIVAIDKFALTFFFSSLPVANAGLDQVICNGETAILTASGGPNFLWNTGETTATIEVTPTATEIYTVTVSDDEGNTDEDSVTVTVNDLPIANAGEDQTICEGESVILTASGGTSYLWNTGETTASIEVNPELETIYSVEVTSNDCSSTDEVTIFVNEAPIITVTEDIVIIEGESITLTANGGDNYEWNTGDTTDSIIVTPEVTTTYSVSSLSAEGCLATQDVIVTVIPEVVANAGDDITICSGETTTLSASGGSTYLWDSGEEVSDLSVSPTETTTYTVTVEDDYGFTDTDTVTVFVNEIPNITANEDVFVMFGNSVTLTANGGISYIWNTSETTAEIIVSPEVNTTYTVTGFSEDGCQNTIEILVTVVDVLSANAGEDVSICLGESITLNASGGVTYTWNTGNTGSSPTFAPLETTTYTVTVEDGFGNSDSDEVTITVNPMPIANAGEDQIICNGESVVLTAEGGDSYLWSTGATTASITVNPNEDTTYSVEVTTNNCSSTDDVMVTVLPTPEIIISEDTVIITGNSTTLEVSGGDSYLWNTGETTDILVANPTETTTYTVTAFMENGCESTSEVTVTVIPEVVAEAGDDVAICSGESIVLNASGGLTYLWDTGDTSSTITVSPTETITYTVTVTDDYGNSDSDSVTVTVNELPSLTVSESIVIFEGESTNLIADGAETYLWNTGETSNSISVTPAETTNYTVTGFSINGCVAIAEVTVTVIPEVIANAGDDVTICAGDSVTLNASGSSNYSWNTGDTVANPTFAPTETTTYTVTVSDDYGNSDTDSVTIIVNELPNINLIDETTILIGETAILEASGGSESYLWNTGETTPSITVNPSVTTTYSITGFSANGCQKTEEVLVVVVPLVIANAGFDVAICNGSSVTLNALGGSNYLWSTGQTTASISVSPTETTSYTVTVSDDYGNSDTDSVTVTVDEFPNLVVSENITIYEGESATLNVNGAQTYLWSTNDTSSTIVVNPTETTTYSVTGFSTNGCETTEQVVVTVLPPQVIANAGNDVAICIGESVTLNATGGGGSNFSWNTGQTGASVTFSPTETTTYTVTVSDDFGYSDTDSVTVTVNELPNLVVSENITIFEGESTNLIADGAETYIWNTGDTSSSIVVSPLETTTYIVTGFSTTGCEVTTQVVVTVIPEIIANAGNDVSICIGESVTLNASGGVSYIWNTGGTGASPTFTPTETTTYTVTVSDNLGNSDTDSVTVTVNELPVITVSENITIIEGESTTLSVNGAETYLWSTGDASNSIVVSPSQTTTYTVIGLTNSCDSSEEEITVTVTPLFVASAGSDEYVCDNQTYDVVLTASQGDSYLWSTGETTQSITVSPLSTSTYTVTVQNNGQEDTDDVTVYVDPSPDVVIANGDYVEILNGDFITLSASGANTYEWSNGATQPNIAVSPTITTTYEVRGYIGDCYDDKEVVVNVYHPVIADAGEDVVICINEMTTLTADGGDEYVWSTGETTQSIQVSPDETTDYTVTVFNPLDFDEATVTVEVDLNCTEQIEDPITGIPKDFKFNVYPNPAKDLVNIKFSGVLVVSDLHIYDVTGKLIQRTQIANENISTSSTIQVDISSLQSGVYFVKLIGEEKDTTERLIVQ